MKLRFSGTNHPFHRGIAGLTRKEVLALVLTFGTLAIILGFSNREQVIERRQLTCMENLQNIGNAMSLYISDNRKHLPFAYMQPKGGVPHTTWDGLIESTVRVALRGDVLDLPAPPATQAFSCPDDTLEAMPWPSGTRPKRRSYSMTEYDMKAKNWPPNANRATGLGLGWNEYVQSDKVPSSFGFLAKQPEFPAIPVNIVFEPAATILVTEQIQTNNLSLNAKGATIATTIQHLDAKEIPWASFQKGKINYLMVDGHVEALAPEATVGTTGQVGDDPRTHLGMWTLKVGD